MPLESIVYIKGNPNAFIVDCYIDGWALLKREVKGVMRIVDWYFQTELQKIP